jgi:hypothetical protein
VAHQARAAGGAPTVIRLVMAVGWLVMALASVPPEALAINTDSYRAAAASGSIGVVTGRIYEERKRPETPDHPLAGAAVIVLPKSAEVLRKLEEIKQTARNSADDYRAAGPSILAVRRAYEKELWDSGAVDLVKTTTVGADGRFVVPDLPAGDWLLIATHAVKIDKPTDASASKRDSIVSKKDASASKKRSVYAPGTRLTGYQRVMMWLREVTVSKGQSENLELSDRGAWFSGVVEERSPDAGR